MNLSAYLKEANINQMEFARQLGVTQGMVFFWLHKKPPTIERCIQIEKLTKRKVTCEELRPDVDWAYLRATDCGVKVGAGDTALIPQADREAA